MIKLRSLINNSKVKVIYLSKSEIGRMTRNETESVTYITMKNDAFLSYEVIETPEEILAMPDIETSEKVVDWEQRRYEIAKDIMAAACIRPGVLCISQVTDIADALITELKKGQNND